MEFLKKHHDDPPKWHLATKKIYNTFCQKYFQANIYKQIEEYSTSCLIYPGSRVNWVNQLKKCQLLFIFQKHIIFSLWV